jgi:hypothetical protein
MSTIGPGELIIIGVVCTCLLFLVAGAVALVAVLMRRSRG